MDMTFREVQSIGYDPRRGSPLDIALIGVQPIGYDSPRGSARRI